jgi:PAS domain S-box-containing protein
LRAEAARLMRTVQQPATPPKGLAVLAGPPAQPTAVGRWRINHSISKQWALRLSVQVVTEGIKDLQAAAQPRGMRTAAAPRWLLVCFERRPMAEVAAAAVTEREDGSQQAQTALEEELATTREHLYTVIEELETSNEESQSLNEEIQTANEELQSTNEELEASNEELQASNEELTTVNEELQVKSLEWQALTSELEGIYANLDFPLLAFDENLVLRRINRAVFRQLGMDVTWLGKPLGALPWPAGMPDLLADCLEVQAHVQSRSRLVHHMGARHWALRIMPRQAPGGARMGVLLHMEDVTQLRESEVSAMRNAALLRELVERSAQLMCLCDPSGRLLVANPEFARHHNLHMDQATGSLLTELLAPADAQAFRAAQLEAMRTLKPLEQEELLLLEGQQRDLLASYYPLFDDAGAVTGVCYQAIDVTRRKQAEQALLVANSAKLAAESLARTKGSFLANMSHEIRTPMNAVVGLSRMVLDDELPDAVRDPISKVHEAALALTRVLDDVLDFSKMEAGEMRFELRPFRLDEVLQGVKSLFMANASEKGLQVQLDLPLGVPMQLVGDALRLSQVLNNLVSNALKFTQQGSIRISVAPQEQTAPGQCLLRFAVRDTGLGIAEPLREALFDPFVQGDASVTRRFGGTGLGLAICRRLVDLMGGRIGVDSEPGQGSEFWFVVSFEVTTETRTPAPALAQPLAGPARTAALNKAQAQALLGQTLKQALGGPRVLLAEDNALNQIVGRAVLERLGLEVELAEDGQQTLDLLTQHPVGHYQALLMDMHMPVVDGLEATRLLRKTPQGGPLLVVALTAAALSEDRDQCLQAGMDGHTAKPLVPEQLVDELLHAARRRRSGEGPRAAAGAAATGLVATPSQGAQAAAPVAQPAWPRVPGFDLRPLFERLNRNEQLVWQLLEEFVTRERVTAAELQRLMQEQKLDEARKRSHALMGSAVTIGATLVARTSAGLEAALGEGMASPSMVTSVGEALAASLAAAQQALERRLG